MIDGFANRGQETLDARSVAPVSGELPRTSALGSTQLGIGGEVTECPRRRIHVTSTHENAVLAIAKEIVSCSDAIREDERESARRRLVDDDRPRLSLGQEREDVGGRIELDDLLPIRVPSEHHAYIELLREPFEPCALRPVSC